MTTMIDLEQVSKLYGPVIGINDMTLSLEPGAYGLLGPNGSGKSTLLNMITGQLRPTLGSIRVMGQDPWNNNDVLREIGYCPGVEILYSNVTSLEWVCYLLELQGFSAGQSTVRAKEALDLVGLTDAMNRSLGGYSRGMRQRAKLAQAIANRPRLLILDEPFNGLDPIGRHDMTQLLRKWVTTGGSVLVASHILFEVEALTDAFLLICGGRLLATGNSEEIHELMTDLPSDIEIRCDDTQQLARLLIGEDTIESVRFKEGGETLVVSTRSLSHVFSKLPNWVQGTNVGIREIRAPDQSLQTLFNTLMQIHRGEK